MYGAYLHASSLSIGDVHHRPIEVNVQEFNESQSSRLVDTWWVERVYPHTRTAQMDVNVRYSLHYYV